MNFLLDPFSLGAVILLVGFIYGSLSISVRKFTARPFVPVMVGFCLMTIRIIFISWAFGIVLIGLMCLFYFVTEPVKRRFGVSWPQEFLTVCLVLLLCIDLAVAVTTSI